MENIDLYELLGVEKGATKEEIKKAYRRKSAEYHPDKTGGSMVKQSLLNLAKETLIDEEKRSHYDKTGTVEGRRLDIVNKRAETVLASIACQIVDSPIMPDNIIEYMEKNVEMGIDAGLNELNKYHREMHEMELRRGRMKAKNGAYNYFDGYIDQKIEEMKIRIEKEELGIEVMRRVAEMVYDFEDSEQLMAGLLEYGNAK